MPRIATLTRRETFGDRRARVAVARMPRQQPIGQHRHEFFEIAIVLSGSAVHVTGGFRHRIEAGDALFLDPRRAHGYEETRDLNLLNILIRDDTLARLGRELDDRPGYHALFRLGTGRDGDGEEPGFRRRLRLAAKELEQVDEWASRIEEARGFRKAARLLEEAYLVLIIDVLSRRHGHSLPRPRGPEASPLRLQARLGRTLGWIERNLARPLRVAELAARAGMSERTFQRLFRAATGSSPHAYVLRARLVRAAARLARAAPGETVTETAQACGFDDSNYFARCFRRFAGTSPTAYRKRALSPVGARGFLP